MQKAVFPIQSHADITKAINYMHTNYTQAINEGKPLRVVTPLLFHFVQSAMLHLIVLNLVIEQKVKPCLRSGWSKLN